MTLQARLDALKERHAALELRIADEDQRPRPDSETLTRLKIEKLRVKEEDRELVEWISELILKSIEVLEYRSRIRNA